MKPPSKAPCHIYALFPTGEHYASKTHIFEAGQYVGTDSHSAGWEFRATRSPALGSIRDLADVAEAVGAAGGMIIRGEPRDHVTFSTDAKKYKGVSPSNRLVNVQYSDDNAAPSWRRCDQGRPWVMLDLDGLAAPDWFPEDPTEEDLERAVEYAREQLPPPFRDVSCWYQWSSSAGVKGWDVLKLHLLFWLDRPVLSYAAGDAKAGTIKGYVERWNKSGKGTDLDAALFSPVQKHFIAPPMFKGTGADGEPMADPLAGRRSGMLEGKRDIVSVPAEILTPQAFFEKKALREAAEARKREKRAVRIQTGTLRVDGDTALAEAVAALEKACHSIKNAGIGDRHAIMSAKSWRVYMFVNAGVLDDATAEAALTAAFLEVKPDGEADIKRSIDGARANAPPVDITQYATETGKPPEGLREPTEVFEATSIDAAREILAKLAESATDHGVTVYKVPAGLGKSYAFKRVAVDLVADGRKAIYATPSHDLGDEITANLRKDFSERIKMPAGFKARFESSIKKAPGRGELIDPEDEESDKLCPVVGEYMKRENVSPSASLEFCRACKMHPNNAKDREDWCEYWKRRDFTNGAGLEVTTHPAASFAAQGAQGPGGGDKALIVGWAKIKKILSGGLPARVILRESENQQRISLEIHPDGEPFPGLGAGATAVEDTYHRAILRALAERIGAQGEDAESIRARLIETDRVRPAVDLLIIDESSDGLTVKAVGIGAQGIEDMRRAGEIAISADDSRTLGDLLEESKEEHRTIYGDEIAARLPAESITVLCAPGEYFAGADHLKMSEEELEAVRNWRVLDGLRGVLRDNWGGAYIRGGVLMVPYIRRVPWRHLARAVVVLDATATPDSARAMFGEDVRFCEVRLKNKHYEAIHIPYGMGPRNIQDGKSFRRDMTRDVWQAAHKGYDSPKTLHLTHKKWLNDGTETSEYFKKLDGKKTYFESTTARGSNEYVDFDTVVVDSFFCAGGAKYQTAYAFCTLAGEDWTDPKTCARWEHTATVLKEYAPIYQAVNRVRPMLATEEKPVKLIFIDKREPKVFDKSFENNKIIAHEEIIAHVLGNYHGLIGAGILLNALVSAAPGGVLLPRLISLVSAWNIKAFAAFQELFKVRGKVAYIYTYATLPLTVNNFPGAAGKLLNFQENHFSKSWESFAKDCGLNFALMKNSAGQATALIYAGDLSEEKLSTALRDYDHTYDWVEVAEMKIDLAPTRADLWSALIQIPVGLTGRSRHQRTRLIADALGCSRSTARRKVERSGWGWSEIIKEHRDHWYGVHLVETAEAQRDFERWGA